MGLLRPGRPSAPMLIAVLALFVALGGPAQAAKLINGGNIKSGTVGSKQIKDRSLKPRDFAPGTIGALTATPEGSIGPGELEDDAVTARALAPDSVLTGHIVDSSLTSADLGANSVGTDEVADNAVGQSEIRTNGVGSSEIAGASIDGSKVIDGGLSVRDVARQVGALEWKLPSLGPGECVATLFPIRGVDIAGAFLLLTPTSPWPPRLDYTVAGTTAANAFRIQACLRAGVEVTRAKYTFNYAVLGY